MDTLAETAVVKAYGGQALAIPFVDGYWMTALVRKIRGCSDLAGVRAMVATTVRACYAPSCLPWLPVHDQTTNPNKTVAIAVAGRATINRRIPNPKSSPSSAREAAPVDVISYTTTASEKSQRKIGPLAAIAKSARAMRSPLLITLIHPAKLRNGMACRISEKCLLSSGYVSSLCLCAGVLTLTKSLPLFFNPPGCWTWCASGFAIFYYSLQAKDFAFNRRSFCPLAGPRRHAVAWA